MTAAELNVRIDQSNDDFGFIKQCFLLNRNVELRSSCGSKQQRCHSGFLRVPGAFSWSFRGWKPEDCPEMIFACPAQDKEFRCRTEPASSHQDWTNDENIPSCLAPG